MTLIKPIVFVAVSLCFGLMVFLLPNIDLAVSGWFFVEGSGFIYKDYWVFRVFYDLFAKVVPWIVGFLLVIMAVIGIKKRRFHWQSAYLLLALVVSAIVVEELLKKQVGRARPREVVQFAGEKTFTPAFKIAAQCSKNCSFVSGHAAIGFYFMLFSFVFTRTRFWFYAGLSLGLMLSLTRVAQGGHFFSDVMFSGIFVYAIGWSLYHGLFKRRIQAGQLLTAADVMNK
jgi:lipid A 4'-phosphatase